MFSGYHDIGGLAPEFSLIDLKMSRYGVHRVPIHTEDGIPIRKIFVSNLPPKTTRQEILDVFAQYGFVKSCWVRKTNPPFSQSSPSYAFVTFENPENAHKALLAPPMERVVRGKILRTSPADSWHQPTIESDSQGQRQSRKAPDGAESGTGNEETHEANEKCEDTAVEEGEKQSEDLPYTIVDILNRDCMLHILSYLPLNQLVRSERVCKKWRNHVNDHLQSMRVLKTSHWPHSQLVLTTAILRNVLVRIGPTLRQLEIHHRLLALNDRTASTIGKFCPELTDLKIYDMNTKNWSQVVVGCKKLRSLGFYSCNKLNDLSLTPLVSTDSSVECLTVSNNSHVTGLFLSPATGNVSTRLTALTFYNCYNLQGIALLRGIQTLTKLTTLKLDLCPSSVWKTVPDILKILPLLEELSLCEYVYLSGNTITDASETLCEALSGLTKLKVLKLSRNINITDTVLRVVARTCSKLQTLDLSGCNSLFKQNSVGVTDEGITAVANSCQDVRDLELSYLSRFTAAGVRALRACHQLRRLVVRGSSVMTDTPLSEVVEECHELQELDVCGCECVSVELVNSTCKSLERRPRNMQQPIKLFMASTAIKADDELPRHPLLILDTTQDNSQYHLRPDFVDRTICSPDTDSDDLDSEDLDFNEFLDLDEDFFDGDLMDVYDEDLLEQLQWGIFPEFWIT